MQFIMVGKSVTRIEFEGSSPSLPTIAREMAEWQTQPNHGKVNTQHSTSKTQCSMFKTLSTSNH